MTEELLDTLALALTQEEVVVVVDALELDLMLTKEARVLALLEYISKEVELQKLQPRGDGA